MSRFTASLFAACALLASGCSDKKEMSVPSHAPSAEAAKEGAGEQPPSTDKERGAIIGAITKRFPALQECVQSHPEAERPGNEPIEVKFRVNTDGKADQIEVKSESKVAVSCFTKWIESTEFPAPSRPISVSFPYQFR